MRSRHSARHGGAGRHKWFTHPDNPSPQDSLAFSVCEWRHAQHVVKRRVEDVADRLAAPLEATHRVLGDRHEVEAVADAENALDVVDEAPRVLARLELVELIDADNDHLVAGKDLEEAPKGRDELGQTPWHACQLGLDVARELDDPRVQADAPAHSQGALEEDDVEVLASQALQRRRPAGRLLEAAWPAARQQRPR